MPTVVRLPAGKALTVRSAADVFLDSLGNANTLRSYATGVGKTAQHLGEARPFATVADDEVGGALEQLWGEAAVNTWNARRAAVLSWLGWCTRARLRRAAGAGLGEAAAPTGLGDPGPLEDGDRPADRSPRRPPAGEDLWRMLYETCARAEEILGVNIEELDLAGRRTRVKAKGAQPRTRRRGAAREDFVLEPVYWDAGAARLLPRLIKGRTRGPVFATHRRPGPGKVVSARDVCPDTGLARLSYGQARALLDAHTAMGGIPGTGWDLHEWRHTGLTHLGEAGASLPMLMAKSRHKKPENVRRYFHPSPEAIAEVTSLLAPGNSRR